LFSFPADVLCDPSNADQWGTLCAALQHADIFQTLGATAGSFTIFAPSNDAFASLGDYALDALFQNQKQLQNLISVHIAPLVIPYAALLCNLNTEMLNFDVTYTLCIGGVKFQAGDGNEIHNLPIIDEPEDIKTKNGIIYPVNNLLLPFQFSIDDITEYGKHDAFINEGNVVNDENVNELVEDIGESNDEDFIDDSNNATITPSIIGKDVFDDAFINEGDVVNDENVTELVEDIGESDDEDFIDDNNDATITPSIIGEDVFGSNYNSSDIVTDDDDDDEDIEGNDDDFSVDFFDAANSSIAISTSPLSSVMNILADSIANRTESCKVCENRELCATPRTAVMMVPGEGEERCTDVIDRQNKGRGIMMGPHMCKALQERFQYSCLDENKPSSEDEDD
jgi:uncharacterized surface protein with fasciclin (FAS1) repeats